MSGLSYLFNGRFRADPFPHLRDSEADVAPKGSPEAKAAIERVRQKRQADSGISQGIRGKEQPVQYDRDPHRTATVLATIRRVYAETDLPLTVRDIQQACALSSTSVADFHIRKLEGEGKIRRDPGKARSIRPVIEEAAA